ncbi:MAG: potassium-transporting ATPase subunit KdpA [Bryobacteraceae bacterium]
MLSTPSWRSSLAGLMVGRTPEYLCKKIEQKEVKMAMLAMLVLAASVLLFSAGGVAVHFAKNALINPPERRPGT